MSIKALKFFQNIDTSLFVYSAKLLNISEYFTNIIKRHDSVSHEVHIDDTRETDDMRNLWWLRNKFIALKLQKYVLKICEEMVSSILNFFFLQIKQPWRFCEKSQSTSRYEFVMNSTGGGSNALNDVLIRRRSGSCRRKGASTSRCIGRRGFRGSCLGAHVIVPINQRRYSSKGPMPYVLIGPRS